jgi:tetratricopeptide (TPR) repeat protein
MSRFTDRDPQQAIFHRHLASAAESPVLVFFGVGGAGKTWLLQKLRETLPASLPSAYLDLEPRAGGQRFLADPAAGLREIRQQFGVPAPRFDLAYAMMRFKEGALAEPGLRGEGALGLTLELAAEFAQKAAATLPGVNVVLNRLSHHLRTRLRDTPLEKFLAGAIGGEFVLTLRKYSSQEIGNNLLDWLAEDMRENLNVHLNRAVRAVLFIDTFEAVGHGLQNAEHQRFREQWIREMSANFDFALIVIAGQNRLTWADAEPDWEEHLDQRLVGGLSEQDARRFLALCGILQTELQNSILETARESEDSFHCFSLGLCADIVDVQRESGHDLPPDALRLRPGDWEALARRFLKSLSSDAERRWIERLALTPRFDETAARNAFSSTRSTAQDEQWETLPDFSFVELLSKGWFAIRSQMRWALENQPAARERAVADHHWWREHWTSRSSSPVDDMASLAWYHHYAQEPVTALEAWKDLIESAREASPPRMREHLALLQWWEPVGLLDMSSGSEVFAQSCLDAASECIVALAGNWALCIQQTIDYCRAAQSVFTEQSHPRLWADAEYCAGLGWLRLPSGDRPENVRQAILCFGRALHVHNEKDSPEEWAYDQVGLAGACAALTTGNRTENLNKAMDILRSCERVISETSNPQPWIVAQLMLARTWFALNTGNRTENLNRAKDGVLATLRVLTEHDQPIIWAGAQNLLSSVLRERDYRTGETRQAMECAEAALRVFTEEEFPQPWAEAQINIGAALADLNEGDREQNLRRAIDHYNLALRAVSEQTAPHMWALSQSNLGYAYAHLPAHRPEDIRLAIDFYNSAARIYNERDFPNEWAETHYQLGDLWLRLPTGERARNLDVAIDHLEASLRVYTETQFPADWAASQRKLASAWRDYPEGDRSLHRRRAIENYRSALRIYSESENPLVWAEMQDCVGNLLLDLPGDEEANRLRAIDHFEASARVNTEDRYPKNWAALQFKLANTRSRLQSGDRRDNLLAAIRHFEAALRIYTEEKFPRDFAEVQFLLGSIWFELPDQDPAACLHRAAACFEAALRCSPLDRFPENWAVIQKYSASVWWRLRVEDPTNLSRALGCRQATLQVYTEESFPLEWAYAQKDLGCIWNALPGDEPDNLRAAVNAFQLASRVFTQTAYPSVWIDLQESLGVVFWRLSWQDEGASLPRAMECLEALLAVVDRNLNPQNWAKMQAHLGYCYRRLNEPDRAANIRAAIMHFEQSLSVHTQQHAPEIWADLQAQLETARAELEESNLS